MATPNTHTTEQEKKDDEQPHHIPLAQSPITTIPLKSILKNRTEQSPITPNGETFRTRNHSTNSSDVENEIATRMAPSLNTSVMSETDSGGENDHFVGVLDSRTIVATEKMKIGKAKIKGKYPRASAIKKDTLYLTPPRKHDEHPDDDENQGQQGIPNV